MKRKGCRILSALISALCFIFCFSAFLPDTASANSAQNFWFGVTASGAIVSDQDCPVVVDSEVLTFNLAEFPTYYQNQDELAAYTGKVTAKYVFRNPASYTVNMTLAFPFGHLPDYAYSVKPDEQFMQDNYGVTVNGEQTAVSVRHTYSPYYFVLDADMPRLHDGFKDDDFYFPEMTVTRYDYNVSVAYRPDEVFLETTFDGLDKETTRTAIQPKTYQIWSDDPVVTEFNSWVSNGDTVSVFFFGGDASPVFNLYKNYDQKEKADASLSLKRKTVTTFKELVLSSRPQHISEIDWYNAMLDYMYENGGVYSGSTALTEEYIMQWYEYSLTISAGGRVENEVTAPMYPAIDGDYEPPVYKYEYLLSPASSWKSFGRLEIRVLTPFYLSDGSLPFTADGESYVYRGYGLPDGELTFSLCESASPERVKSPYSWIWVLVALVFFVILSPFIAAIVILIVFLVKKHNKKKRTADKR